MDKPERDEEAKLKELAKLWRLRSMGYDPCRNVTKEDSYDEIHHTVKVLEKVKQDNEETLALHRIIVGSLWCLYHISNLMPRSK